MLPRFFIVECGPLTKKLHGIYHQRPPPPVSKRLFLLRRWAEMRSVNIVMYIVKRRLYDARVDDRVIRVNHLRTSYWYPEILKHSLHNFWNIMKTYFPTSASICNYVSVFNCNMSSFPRIYSVNVLYIRNPSCIISVLIKRGLFIVFLWWNVIFIHSRHYNTLINVIRTVSLSLYHLHNCHAAKLPGDQCRRFCN